MHLSLSLSILATFSLCLHLQLHTPRTVLWPLPWCTVRCVGMSGILHFCRAPPWHVVLYANPHSDDTMVKIRAFPKRHHNIPNASATRHVHMCPLNTMQMCTLCLLLPCALTASPVPTMHAHSDASRLITKLATHPHVLGIRHAWAVMNTIAPMPHVCTCTSIIGVF